MALRILAVLMTAFILGVGCATSKAASGTGASLSSEGMVAPGDAKLGDKSWCPVSGEELTVAADSAKLEHDGKSYYFCCPHCSETFKAEPAKFVGKPRAAGGCAK